jgi:hypothetical protein
MTTEERWRRIEDAVNGHEARLELLVNISERQQTLLERQDARLDEQRRDNAMTRRLWVRLAQKYGWVDEDGLFDEPE